MQRLIFETGTGDLYYNADGAGVGPAVKFAKLLGVSELLITDFILI